jgi:hypothetical protein
MPMINGAYIANAPNLEIKNTIATPIIIHNKMKYNILLGLNAHNVNGVISNANIVLIIIATGITPGAVRAFKENSLNALKAKIIPNDTAPIQLISPAIKMRLITVISNLIF